MKKIILLLFLFTSISWSQNDTSSFFVQIPNSHYVPKVSYSKTGKRINSTKTQNRRLNTLINSYKIYSAEKVFKNTKKAALKNTYLIECSDSKLMKKLEESFSNFYFYLHDTKGETLEENIPCPFPVDFGTNGGHIDTQEELNYIRAPEAWCITEGKDNVIIGIVDTYLNLKHEDIKNKVDVKHGTNNATADHNGEIHLHGNRVSSMAAADTNNSSNTMSAIGMSAIGYKSFMYNSVGFNWVSGVDELSQLPGVKVINASWANSYNPNGVFYDEVVNDRGVVVVAAAGNGNGAAAYNYIKPAAFKDVISVGTIGHENNTWANLTTQKDHHQFIFNGLPATQQHNDSIDIVAPGLSVLVAGRNDLPFTNDSYYRSSGTSYAAPMVSGTVALMFDVNYCLKPKEIESILKLTATKIDHLPFNQQWYGKLGAGKLDAYEAVKMAKDMHDPFGKVEVKDRILYRWFYKLETAPYEIEMKNNDVTGNARLKFKARKKIAVKSGHYYPQTGGKMHLSIDKGLVLDNCTPRPTNLSLKYSEGEDTINVNLNNGSLFEVYPTLFNQQVTVSKKDSKSKETMDYIVVYNILGKEMYKKENVNTNKANLNLGHLQSGIYLVKVFNSKGINIDIKKIIKN